MNFKKFLFVFALFALTFPGLAKPTKTATPAPSSTLPAASLNGARVFVKYSLVYYPQYSTEFDQLVLFPNGTAFDEVPEKPIARFDVATLRTIVDSRSIGQWKTAGKTLVLNFPRGQRTLRKHPKGWFDGTGALPTDSAYDIYYPVTTPPRARLLGNWQFKSLIAMGTVGGTAPMVAHGETGQWNFKADGTWSDGSQTFTSATTTNMGEAYGGKNGGVTSLDKSRQSSAGKWRIDGPLLTLEKNGQRTVHLAFLMPNWSKNPGVTDLMIDGDRWTRPKK